MTTRLQTLLSVLGLLALTQAAVGQQPVAQQPPAGSVAFNVAVHDDGTGINMSCEALELTVSAADGASYNEVFRVPTLTAPGEEAAALAADLAAGGWAATANGAVLTVQGHVGANGQVHAAAGANVPVASLTALTLAQAQAKRPPNAQPRTGPITISFRTLPLNRNTVPPTIAPSVQSVRVRVVGPGGVIHDVVIVVPQPCTPEELAALVAADLSAAGWDLIVVGATVVLRSCPPPPNTPPNTPRGQPQQGGVQPRGDIPPNPVPGRTLPDPQPPTDPGFHPRGGGRLPLTQIEPGDWNNIPFPPEPKKD